MDCISFLFGLLLILTGLVPTIERWDFTLGTSMAKPTFLLLSIGLVLLFRKYAQRNF